MTMIKVFFSSVQREFADERELLCKYIREDALLGKFFQPFIFENLPAINLSASQAYLSEAATSEIYLGLYGRDYGYEDAEGLSPTEREYDTATENNRHRIVFIKRCCERHPKEKAFIQKVEQNVVRKSFETYEELRTAVYSALVRFLEEKEYLRLLPWDASICPAASMEDIDEEKVEEFVVVARKRRNFALQHGLAVITRQTMPKRRQRRKSLSMPYTRVSVTPLPIVTTPAMQVCRSCCSVTGLRYETRAFFRLV